MEYECIPTKFNFTYNSSSGFHADISKLVEYDLSSTDIVIEHVAGTKERFVLEETIFDDDDIVVCWVYAPALVGGCNMLTLWNN